MGASFWSMCIRREPAARRPERGAGFEVLAR